MTAKSIIAAVCDYHGVTVEDIRYTIRANEELTTARRDAIFALRKAKYSLQQIERLLGISYSSIEYHLYPRRRAAVRRNRDRFLERQAAEVRT